MSMYRQLWLAIIVSTLLALLGSLMAATLSARVYLSQQLSMKNTDNAAALALALSQQQPDAVAVELAVAALFDSGHYEMIRVIDPFGKPIVERRAPPGERDVPDWFASRLPIVAAPGIARISNGWKQFGTIELVSHSRFAYRALWKSVWEMVSAVAVAGLVGGYLGTLVLRRLRRPLKAVIDQAQAITERRFVTIDEPRVPELRQLAAAMNVAVGRLKAMFAEEAARLDNVRREANCDPLTGLVNRNHFLARFSQALADEDVAAGSLTLVRVADLAGINHRLGRAATDECLARIAAVIADAAGRSADAIAARLNGADFALLMPNVTAASAIVESLLKELEGAAEPYTGDLPVAYLGYGGYRRGEDPGTVMARVDAALAAVEAESRSGAREAVLTEALEQPKSGDDWVTMIGRALDRRWLRLVAYPVNDFTGASIHRECPLRMMVDEDGEWLPAGRFLPMAERLRMTAQLDFAAVSLALDQLDAEPNGPGLAVNLSATSLEEDGFRTQLVSALRKRPAATRRLWLEVAEAGALRHLDAMRRFVGALKGSGCRIGIEHFGRQSSQIGLLHDLGLDYLKVDASFVHDLDRNAGNQAFLRGLGSIAHGIGLTVIAEGVRTEAELVALAALGFDGATGPGVRDTGK